MAKDVKVDGYNSGAAPSPAPAAAEFGRGVSDLAGVKQATDARRAHSAALTKSGQANDRNQAPGKVGS